MPQEKEKTARDWRQIVADAYNETDPEKLRKLAEELDRVLDERDKSSPNPRVPLTDKKSE